MTLEFDKFKLLTKEFLSLTSSFGDQWVLKGNDDAKYEDFYLEKRCTLSSFKHQYSNSVDGNNEISPESFCIFVYHIVYSQSYRVPVLYFNAYHTSGKLFTLDEIWKEIPECYKNDVDSNKWHMITQQDHPKLGIPYFMVHPCYTADFMSSCPSSNYIITWLSIIGPLVGIHLSNEYAKYVKPVKKGSH